MTEELFEKNLRLLKLVSPELSRRVIWAKGREEIEGFTARSGAPSLRVCTPDGGSILLHSSYDPEEEARRAAEASGLDEPHRNIFFLGFGLGYLPLEVMRRKGHEKRFFFIIEKDLSIFREAMERVDLSELLSDVRVYLLVDLPEEELARRLRFLTEQTLYHGVEFLELPGAMALHGDYYRGARSLVAEMVGVNSMYWSTTFLRGSQSVRNICRNLFCILQSPGVRPLKGAFEGRPALIVSAGPSLDGAIEGVRAAKGKALIIAIGQVLGKLLRAGIEPDLVATLDYSDLNWKLFFRDIEIPPHIPLVAEFATYWEVVHKFQGPKFINYTGGEGFFGLGPLLKEKGTIAVGGTVAIMALGLAKHLGVKPVLLVGQDFCFNGVTHSGGTSIQGRIVPLEGQPNVMLRVNPDGKARPFKAHRVEGTDGEEKITDPTFFSFLKETELLIHSLGLECINTSPSGARIKGTREMSLEEALETFCQEPFDARSVLEGLASEGDISKVREARRILLERVGELTSIAHSAQKGRRLCRTFKRLAEQKKLNDKRIEEVAQELRNLYAMTQAFPHLKDFLLNLIFSTVYVTSREIARRVKEAPSRRELLLQEARHGTMYFRAMNVAARHVDFYLRETAERLLSLEQEQGGEREAAA